MSHRMATFVDMAAKVRRDDKRVVGGGNLNIFDTSFIMAAGWNSMTFTEL